MREVSVLRDASVARLLVVLVLVGVVACGGGGSGGNQNPGPERPGASANQLNVTIVDATIASDDRPVVRFFLTDAQGEPLPSDGVNLRLVVAALERDGGEYRDYLTTVQTTPDGKTSAR